MQKLFVLGDGLNSPTINEISTGGVVGMEFTFIYMVALTIAFMFVLKVL